ncbi:MAG: SCO family protein [Deltaproteobacteria bacterium]|nr:SCO family protein [Deltaproteobacteria bacterium]
MTIRSWLPFCAVVLLINSPIFVLAATAPQSSTQRREVKLAIGDFILTDQSGQTFRFSQLGGKVVLVSFAYTTCPDVCPLLTASMRQVQIGLSATERKDIQLLTITTDPEIDAPKVLAGYAQRYGAELDNWAFLTGEESKLRAVWKNFGVGVKRKGRGLIDHTPLTAIVDRHGTLRVVYIGPNPVVTTMLSDLRALLADR